MFYGSSVGTLARVPVFGGAPREILENVDSADWAADGKTLAVVRKSASGFYQLEFPIDTVLYKAEGAMHILGCYALSLEAMDHDYLKHPRFYDFACGMMAHLSAPDHVRYDIDLQAEFPAKELPGLCGRMMWSGKGLRPTERLRAIGDKRLLI